MVMKQQRAIFTIISINYINFANVLAKSLIESHTKLRLICFISDITEKEWNDMNIEDTIYFDPMFVNNNMVNDLSNRAMKYNITEFNTSIKPGIILYLSIKYDKIIYLDPDIYVFGDLQYVFQLLDMYNIIITPHITQPINDSYSPNEINFLRVGTYNLGFIAIKCNDETNRMLSWWSSRLSDFCYNATQEGLFTDQKWIDLVPSLFGGVYILKNPGYNVAYWNLHYRYLEKLGSGYYVNKLPLIFFHFSGFNVSQIFTISKYQDRMNMALRPDVNEIYLEYAKHLLNYSVKFDKQTDYRFGFFNNGKPVSDLTRQLYSCLLQQGTIESSDDPFDNNGEFYAQAGTLGFLTNENNYSVKEYSGTLIKIDDMLSKKYKRQHSAFKLLMKLAFKLLGTQRYLALMKYLNHVSMPTKSAIFLHDK